MKDNQQLKLRKMTFFPPFIILLIFVIVSIIDQETFLGLINTINNWIIKPWLGSQPAGSCHCSSYRLGYGF